MRLRPIQADGGTEVGGGASSPTSVAPCKVREPMISSKTKGRRPVSRPESRASRFSALQDRSAKLETLYRDHRDAVMRYILHKFGAGPPDPADVVQAAFEKFITLDDHDDIANPRSFLIASARNWALDQRRRLKVRSDYADETQAIESPADDFDPERVLVAKEQWGLLERAIRQLDERRRNVLIMNRMHGLSSAEIARRLGCSATLVKTLLAQALVQCQRALREERP